ncbi:MAG TPA: transposase [Terriglobales bacterium]|nr:transposase [Terriglobales bacterium]
MGEPAAGGSAAVAGWLNPTIAELTQAIDQEVEKSAEARGLMTHPGVGPLTALAFVLIIGKAERFQCGKQIAAYLGLVPLEDFQWRTASAGTYHQARELAVALLAGGVGAGSGAKYSAMAEPVLSPGDATGTKDRESRHGQRTGDSFVLDDAPRMGLRAGEEVRFARGQPGNRAGVHQTPSN